MTPPAHIARSQPCQPHIRAQLENFIDVPGEATYHWVNDDGEVWGVVEFGDGTTVAGDRPFTANELLSGYRCGQ